MSRTRRQPVATRAPRRAAKILAFVALPFFFLVARVMAKHTFKAYDRHGYLVASTWTRVPAAYAAECAAFQARLNRGELTRVDIWSSDPHEPMRRLRPRERPQLSVVR